MGLGWVGSGAEKDLGGGNDNCIAKLIRGAFSLLHLLHLSSKPFFPSVGWAGEGGPRDGRCSRVSISKYFFGRKVRA